MVDISLTATHQNNWLSLCIRVPYGTISFHYTLHINMTCLAWSLFLSHYLPLLYALFCFPSQHCLQTLILLYHCGFLCTLLLLKFTGYCQSAYTPWSIVNLYSLYEYPFCTSVIILVLFQPLSDTCLFIFLDAHALALLVSFFPGHPLSLSVFSAVLMLWQLTHQN